MKIVNVGNNQVNSYVVMDPLPKLLIDTGWPGTLPQFTERCRKNGVEVAKIPFMIITHYHPDHAGLAQELKQFGTRLIVVSNQVDAIADVGKRLKPEDHYVPIQPQTNARLPLENSRACLAKIGLKGEIVPVPSHSEDSIAVVLDEGPVFIGDLLPPLMALDGAEESWTAFRQLGAKFIYPGHGAMWRFDRSPV